MNRHDACRACGRSGLHTFYRVENVPVHSCLMVAGRAEALSFPCGDIELAFCPACGFIQNSRYDPALQAYSPDYEETQIFSAHFRRFLEQLCDDQIGKYALGGKTVLEIGCGKGEFLATLCERGGCSGIGIDPGYRPERMQSPIGTRLQFIRDFYGPSHTHLQADYVCCRHTLEHIGNVVDFMRLVRASIGDRSDVAVFFEVPDTERVLVETAIWDIYYEHCSYFTQGSLARLFHRAGLEPRRLWKAYGGQYLMIEAAPAHMEEIGGHLPETHDLERITDQVRRFGTNAEARIEQLRAQLNNRAVRGMRVVLWGSGSKAVSYLTTLGVTHEIEAVVDINAHKHGKFLAGTGHEIIAPQALATIRPDCVIVMNAIYADEIRADLERMGLSPELVALA
jgi:SAM-dependent methyltransferase